MIPIIDSAFHGIIASLTKSLIEGSKRFRFFFILNAFFLLVGIILKVLASEKRVDDNYNIVAYILIGITALIFAGIYASELALEEKVLKDKIEKVEARIKDNPAEPTAAWELARIKLENYINRNLTQIQWIFFWSMAIMTTGFIIIGYGIYKVFQPPSNINAALITTISGLMIEFIGATFLVIYKSTMEQAKEYVNVLERINAVGMSVQIMDSIDKDESKLQNQTRADIAKQLLDLYGTKK